MGQLALKSFSRHFSSHTVMHLAWKRCWQDSTVHLSRSSSSSSSSTSSVRQIGHSSGGACLSSPASVEPLDWSPRLPGVASALSLSSPPSAFSPDRALPLFLPFLAVFLPPPPYFFLRCPAVFAGRSTSQLSIASIGLSSTTLPASASTCVRACGTGRPPRARQSKSFAGECR